MRQTLIALGALAFAATGAAAQGYPNKPVTIIVPFAAGGNGDITTRFVAEMAKEMWGVPVVVDNKPGAGGAIGIGQVARAAPDGYTIAFVSTSPIVVAPHLGKQPFDPIKDLAYLGRVVINYQPIVVRADSPFKSVKDVVEFARTNPGRFRWSAAAQRGGPQLATEALFKAEKVQTTYVPFQGGSEAMTAVLGGQIEAAVIADYAEQLKAGSIRLLAESGPEKIIGLPDVPTFRDLGYSLAPVVFIGFAGPAAMPTDAVAKWDDALGKIVASQRFIDLAARLNSKVSYADSKGFTKQVNEDYESLGKAIKELGLGQ